MSQAAFTFSQYIKYRMRAVGAHSLHSPFLFRLYNEVIRNKDLSEELKLLKLRRQITDANKMVTFTDPKSSIQKTLETNELVKKVASSHDFSYFLIRLINHLNYNNILEAGTSLGVNTIYLANSQAKEITTIEGSAEIAELARLNFEALNLHNIRPVVGNVKDVFKKLVRDVAPDLIFLDADHRSETIEFYLNCINREHPNVKCIVVHDIYWSPDMKKAWTKIVADPAYNLTVDIFQAGMIFPNYPIEKQHFTIKF